MRIYEKAIARFRKNLSHRRIIAYDGNNDIRLARHFGKILAGGAAQFVGQLRRCRSIYIVNRRYVNAAINQSARHIRAHSANANKTNVHLITLSFCHVERSRDISYYFADPAGVTKTRDSSTSHGRTKGLHTRPAKNGLCCFSSPTVVIGPCPGQMIVSFGNVRIFSRLFRKASRYDTLPPPIDPAKSESPTIAIGRARPVTTYGIPPGE